MITNLHLEYLGFVMSKLLISFKVTYIFFSPATTRSREMSELLEGECGQFLGLLFYCQLVIHFLIEL